MRFNFDFSCPGEEMGEENFLDKKKRMMLVCGVILNSGSDELFKRQQQQISGLTELSNHPGAN